MAIHVYIKDKVIIFDKINRTFIVKEESKTNDAPKNYINYWNVEEKVALVQSVKGFYLISDYVSYFTYENNIVDVFSSEIGTVSILTDKGVLRIIRDSYDTHLMIELINFFDFKTNEKVCELMKKCNFRYIPFILRAL